ncbi:MAG: Glyoxalase-like domain protein [Candidatus Scalindua rubra]|uniref:Glyoxalase-like domain protein n=1 Tax=Candidatus Scalindua rubra TaxID=1872076 RepID=A0A1E3X224_9BACT|nr:MAG: Glyoxalase-like domain protein [Candidatus Scalindua rubra]
MIFDHIGLVVSDYEKSKDFYSECLAPLSINLLMEENGWAGFGKENKPEFWFGSDGDVQKPMHIAFAADSREQVNQFYEAALAAGGIDNGAPGIREKYHPNYYGAFVFDPDGHNVEAVCHKPE